MSFTITDLKKSLGVGMGVMKNKYLLEMPLPQGHRMNVLCRSAGLPARTISTTAVHKHGRKYNMRAETDYGDTWEMTVMDDSNMSIRKQIDQWMIDIDNSIEPSVYLYQQEITIWQLSSNGDKVYGYVLENAFPSGIGEVILSDSEENSLTEFTVTFTFSEFTPIVGSGTASPNNGTAASAAELF